MIHAGLFAKPSNSKYQREQFDWVAGEEGKPVLDRPVSVQFCANSREIFLAAAQLVADNAEVDAVDLNLVRSHHDLWLLVDASHIGLPARHC